MVFKGQIGVKNQQNLGRVKQEKTVAIVERKGISPIKYSERDVTAGFSDKETTVESMSTLQFAQ